MPTYQVIDRQTGEIRTIRGSRPPTEDEIASILDADRQAQKAARMKIDDPRALEPKQSVGERFVEHAVRSAPFQLDPERALNEGVESLPAAGSAVGGAVGAGLGGPTVIGVPVLAAGGAAAGGSSGEALRQWIQSKRGKDTRGIVSAITGGDHPIADVVTQGALGPLSEIAPGAARVATGGLYKSALRGAEPAIMEGFGPQIVKRGLEEGIPVTTGGARTAQGLATRQAQEAGAMGVEAEAARASMRGPGGRIQKGAQAAGKKAAELERQQAARTSQAIEAEKLAQAIRGGTAPRTLGDMTLGDVLTALTSAGGGGGLGAAMGGGIPGAIAGGIFGLGAKAAATPAVKSGAAIAADKALQAGGGALARSGPLALQAKYQALLRLLGAGGDEAQPTP